MKTDLINHESRNHFVVLDFKKLCHSTLTIVRSTITVITIKIISFYINIHFLEGICFSLFSEFLIVCNFEKAHKLPFWLRDYQVDLVAYLR